MSVSRLEGTSERANGIINDSDLETKEEYQQRWFSIRIMYFTMFLMSLGFSIVLTGVWPYLNKLDAAAGKEFMGYVVAANPLAQMLFSPLAGWWGNRLGSIRLPILLSLLIFVLSNASYSLLELLPHPKYCMLVSRFFVGISAANIAICRSYLSAATKVEERTKAVSMVSLAQVLGFIIGPSLQAVVTFLKDGTMLFGCIPFDMYSATGWMNVMLGLINMVLLMPHIFVERPIAAKEAMLLSGAETEQAAWKETKPDYLIAWTMIVSFFILVFNFVLLETLGTSLTMDQFAWSKSEAVKYMGILLSVGSLFACVTFIVIGPLCKKFNETRVLQYGGFLLMVFGRAACMPYGSTYPVIAPAFNGTILNDEEVVGCPDSQEWCKTTPAMSVGQFFVGFVATAIGYPIGVTLIQTIFSKILGPRPQGVWMGLLTGAGCLSRVLGPIFVSYVYTRFGTYWTFGITTVMMIAPMVWLHFVSSRMNSAIKCVSPNFNDVEMTKKQSTEKKMENGSSNSSVNSVNENIRL
ncbi:major facilitator superfamily domain-containing protein 8 [Nilaparvata lugens]|uniref:major facilitator superfamily domain-containing protein 8 n=1 Tax=Nilaparvata lugens TaxID=108931 RepID=UPI00193E3D66|nr:major facilitator superfamily domain-containing protein 8 [Nilaparvata lugens]